MKHHSFKKLALSFLLVSFFYAQIYAQYSDAPKLLSNTYYLQNCFVVKQPGTILPNQNVIIKNGMISDVGTVLKIPYDAQVIKADSMYVYAGFIDAYSNTGIGKEDKKDRPKIQDPGNPPNDIVGITPEQNSSDFFKSSDKSVQDMRSAGFGISHVVPRGLMLPGQSSLFLLGDGPNDKMLLKYAIGQNFQLEGSRGAFPSTSIAVISKFRDLYKNAQIAGSHEEKFKLNPVGLSRPDYSKELMALYPATTKKMPIYFVAKKTKDVHKAISLKDELGFNMVLTEVQQGWHYMDQIKKKNISVLLAVDLPAEDKKDDKKGDGKKDDTSEEKGDSTKTKKVEKVTKDPEVIAFNEKRALSIKEYLSQAGVFEKNNINFGFSFLNVKSSDIKKNIKKMIDNGLSEKMALAALTTQPAQLLGISNLVGTVEKGKIANLVLIDKSYFDEKSSIKYVFVDGVKFDYSEKKKNSEGKSSGKILGTWVYSVETPNGTQGGKMKISKDGESLKVKIESDDSAINEEASDVIADGDKLSFIISANLGAPVKINFDLSFDDKKCSGSVSIEGMGSFPLKGDLQSDPK
jgi:hypothetical protein